MDFSKFLFHIYPHHRKREQQSMKVAAFKNLNQHGLSDKYTGEQP
jgi:hypothetical protein